MYDELIEELRRHHCDAKEDDTQEVCEECAYDVIIADKSVPSGIASVCVCGLMNRAADAIEELSKPKWIPVTERLPEERTDVLAMTADCDIYVCDFIPSVRQFWTIPGDDLHIDDITHWMPLPQPPKEE